MVVLQNKAVRIIKGIGPRDSTVGIFKELRILNLSNMYNFSIAIFMFKYCKGDLPLIFSEMFKYCADVHSYETRRTHHFSMPYCRLDICIRHVRFSGVTIWNKITSELDVYCSIHTFKKRVKHLYISC